MSEVSPREAHGPKEAPLFVQTFQFTKWIMANHPGQGPLVELNRQDALALLDHIVLALKNTERVHHIARADTLISLLRVRLRLARELDLLDDRKLVFLTGELDAIGRQLGGWQRRLSEKSDQAPPS